jgi:hypothetical protein
MLAFPLTPPNEGFQNVKIVEPVNARRQTGAGSDVNVSRQAMVSRQDVVIKKSFVSGGHPHSDSDVGPKRTRESKEPSMPPELNETTAHDIEGKREFAVNDEKIVPRVTFNHCPFSGQVLDQRLDLRFAIVAKNPVGLEV